MSPNGPTITAARAAVPPGNPLARAAGADSHWRRETAEPWLWHCLNPLLALVLLALLWTPKVLIVAALAATPLALLALVLLTTARAQG